MYAVKPRKSSVSPSATNIFNEVANIHAECRPEQRDHCSPSRAERAQEGNATRLSPGPSLTLTLTLTLSLSLSLSRSLSLSLSPTYAYA